MPFIKQEKAPVPCLSSEHYPPTMLVQEPGTYTYQCPNCGHQTTYTVPMIIC